ncbi:RING-H2 finger protein ATL57-like [Carya illinoinensis]|uniref:RING-type E3 ubiquitin transferase n=2 Tax=Carya illinoinensis TaxID=32201 RepID=A0A922DDU2_CARIL|nr:RING-H2 finger protein ATL57-like [Carya illinoinensis]KAG6682480.1 hypothetical protein I3842_13G144000 [Carya illinoinensis]
MKLHGRKLLLTQSLFSLQPITNTPTPPSGSPPGTLHPPSSSYTFMQSPVVLAVLLIVLLAFFLLGCISNCMHQLHDDESHPRLREPGQEEVTSSLSPGSDSNLRIGVDPKTIGALPVYSYCGNSDHKCYEITDCAICLNEFQQKEAVKTIPFCKHVFHPCCIDTWLSSQVTCPVCRSTRFFHDPNLGVRESENIWRVGSNERCIEVMVVGVRRNSSCSSLGELAVLQRTSSL